MCEKEREIEVEIEVDNVHDTYPESICEVVSALWTNTVALEVDLGD